MHCLFDSANGGRRLIQWFDRDFEAPTEASGEAAVSPDSHWRHFWHRGSASNPFRFILVRNGRFSYESRSFLLFTSLKVTPHSLP